MIRRVRAAIPMMFSVAAIFVAAGIALRGGVLLAQGQQSLVTWAEISLLVWTRYGAAVATSIIATWALLAYFQGREDKRREALVLMVEGMNARLIHHNADENAHGPMNEHQDALHHGPLNGRAQAIEEKLDGLILELATAGVFSRAKRRSTDPPGLDDSGEDFRDASVRAAHKAEEMVRGDGDDRPLRARS